MTAKEILALHATPAEQIRQAVMRVAQLPGDTHLEVRDNEQLLRAVAQMPGARAWGIISISDVLETSRICWSVTAQHDRVRVSATHCRQATPAELAAVKVWEDWQDVHGKDTGRTGVLHALVEEATKP